jgi:hypothetical protein
MMSNEEAAAHFIALIGQKMLVLLDNVDIADEDFVDTLEMLDDDLSHLISEITSLKAAASEIMMLESMFEL